MKSELQVKVNQKLGVIDFNYEEMKKELSEKMEQYSDIVVTADTRTVAKKDVASLRKLRKELNDRRIKIKKEYDKPYDEFKGKVDELTGLIDEPIELIDKQLKEFEEKEKEEKKKEIEILYSELIGDNEEYLPLKKIYNTRWENVSFKIKEVKKEISESVAGIDLAVTTIKGMNSEVEDKALELFKGDLSLANAITYINKHEQMKAEILAKEQARRKEEEERKRLAEIERVKSEERKKIAEEEKAERERLAEIERAREEERLSTEKRLMEIIEPEPVEEFIPPQAEELEDAFVADEEPFDLEEPFDTGGDVITSVFKVIGTREDMEQIGIYMNSIGAIWERTDD